jgi:hypothetical protein
LITAVNRDFCRVYIALQHSNDAAQEAGLTEISRQPGLPPLDDLPVFGFALMALNLRRPARIAGHATIGGLNRRGELNF